MTRADLAASLDSEGRLLEAAWAYELAMSASRLSADGVLNLIAIYYSLSDPGRYMAMPGGSAIASVADVRAREILADRSRHVGAASEFEAWNLLFRAHVDGENVPMEAFERLVAEGSILAEFVVCEFHEQLSARARHYVQPNERALSERIRVMTSYL
jgi:hypothetical protein